MAEVLYRKYRSRAFVDVQGQEAILTVLVNSLRNQKFAHAYMFAGPRGTGKTTIARLVAKAVNCERFAELGDVCNQCASCLAVEAGNHMDVLEIDAASNRGIEEIRQIRDTINFLPNSGKVKVYIIDEAHMLTREAFNALLKTLEEPPAHVMFIMATTEAHKVPVTILSRVQRFDFKLANIEQLTAKLNQILVAEGFTAEPGLLEMIYKYSEGSYRDAESILGKILASHEKDKEISVSDASKLLGMPSTVLVAELIDILIAGDALAGLEKLRLSIADGNDIGHLVKSLTLETRNRVTELVKAGKPYERELLILHVLMSLQSEIKMADDMRLLLEVAVLKLGKQPEAKVKIQAEVPQAVQSKPAARPAPAPSTVTDTAPARVTTDVAKSANEGVDAQWDRLLGEVRKKDFRLWTVLKTCKGSLKGLQLILETNYQANVDILQNPEAISKIRPSIDMVYSTDTVIEVIFNGRSKPDFGNHERDFIPDPSNASLVEEIF